MYYRPLLPNARKAPMAWQIQLFFLNITWPLRDGVSSFVRNYDRVRLLAAFIMLIVSNAAEVYYVVDNAGDIGRALEGLATYLILIEMHLRIFSMALQKRQFKAFIGEFYQKIFIERRHHRAMYARIQRSLLPTVLYSYSYIGTLFSYLAIPLIGFFRQHRLLPFKMLFPYDYTPLHLYLPTLMLCLWLGVTVVSFVVAESNLLATLILHLNGRYLLLQQDVRELHESLLGSCPTERVLAEFRRLLRDIVRRNVELNEFASKLQTQYSFRIFVMMGLSAITLCVLGFKAVTLGASSANVTYICWILAKILELVVFGELGSQLIFTTNSVGSMYYMSNWEDVILHSPSALDNAQLMKLITLAIELNQKPLFLSGLNFFSVSLETVVAILQGAGSYFTCLYAFR